MRFKLWLENLLAKKIATKQTILGYLRDKLNIRDESQILLMPLNSLDRDVLHDLLQRGIVDVPDETVQSMIQNGNITVSELIDLVSKE